MVEIIFEDGGNIVPIVADAATEERHRMAAIATKQEVERGVDVTDHVRPEPRILTLTVVISDTPIRPTSDLGGGLATYELDLPAQGVGAAPKLVGPATWQAGAISERAADPVRVQVYTPEREPTRVVDTWRTLLDARDRALLATVTTRLETYESMVLTEATTTRTAADGTWIRVELTFEQLRTASSELVDDPVPLRERDRRQQNRGSQSTEEATDRESVLVQATEGIISDLLGRQLRVAG